MYINNFHSFYYLATGNVVIYSSQLTSSNAIFARSGGFATNYYYETIFVTIPMAGTYVVECTSTIDTFASVYYTTFNISNPATNLLGSVDDSSIDNWEFKFSIAYNSSDTMILVVTTYNPNVVGPFSISVSGPAKVGFTQTGTTIKLIPTTTTPTTTTTTRRTTTKSTTTTSSARTTATVAPGEYTIKYFDCLRIYNLCCY